MQVTLNCHATDTGKMALKSPHSSWWSIPCCPCCSLTLSPSEQACEPWGNRKPHPTIHGAQHKADPTRTHWLTSTTEFCWGGNDGWVIDQKRKEMLRKKEKSDTHVGRKDSGNRSFLKCPPVPLPAHCPGDHAFCTASCSLHAETNLENRLL